VTSALEVTRVVNACVLLKLGDDAFLTDPYFRRHWFMPMREPIGVEASTLPKLSAILGGHGVFDHWRPSSLQRYAYKDETSVFVATRSMANQAHAAGFEHVEVLDWECRRRITPTTELQVAPRETALGMKVNSYVLNAAGLRVFVGTEARQLESLRRYRSRNGPVHVALLPIDGSSLLGSRLVMDPERAIAAAQILGARVLIPIHYANRSIPPLMRTPGTVEELLRLARGVTDLDVVVLAPGEVWQLDP